MSALISVSLLVVVAAVLFGCESRGEKSVTYSLTVAPADGEGLQLGLMNFGTDAVVAESDPREGRYRLTIGAAAGTLADITATREALDGGDVRVTLAIDSAKPVRLMIAGFVGETLTIDGNAAVNGAQLSSGAHKVVLTGRASPRKRTSGTRPA